MLDLILICQEEIIDYGGEYNMFINHEYIEGLLENAKNATNEEIQKVLDKAKEHKGLSHEDIAVLLQIEDSEQLKEMYKIAGDIKKSIYGNRVVVFAPLYISDYCVNNCVYCRSEERRVGKECRSRCSPYH